MKVITRAMTIARAPIIDPNSNAILSNKSESAWLILEQGYFRVDVIIN